jgi:deoxycytidine triphosphate deaminase
VNEKALAEAGAGGGVLSKHLIRAMSESDPKLVNPLDPSEKSLQAAAYDLRLGRVILPGSYIAWDIPERGDSIDLSPGVVATLVSLETLWLPYYVNGVIVPRDSWAKRGLLILNAGHIDPGYQGVVTAQVINLANRPIPLVLEERYFSAIFAFVAEAKQDDAYRDLRGEKEYVLSLRIGAAQAPLSLMHPDILGGKYVSRDELSYELLKRAIVAGVSLAGLIGTVFGILAATGVL